MKLLLDSHIPADVANAIGKRHPGLDVQHLAQWKGGCLLESDDVNILAECSVEGRVWVTYDLATVPDLLARWAEEIRDHAGVFLADDATIPPEKVGALAAAISDLVDELGDTDTTNLVRFLQQA